jgi:hypothetical protein
MSIRFLDAQFDDASLGVHSSRTDDGQVLSILFDRLQSQSTPQDNDAAPELGRAEGTCRYEGSGWISVQVRGSTATTGPHGYAHAFGWVNGRRLQLAPSSSDNQIHASVVLPVDSGAPLRLSLLLLAQRDLAEVGSTAACWVDSIDIQVVPAPRNRR